MSNTDLSIPTIHFLDGLTITLSYEIPQFFNRRHDNMLKKIINLVCSAEFTALNLKASEYLDVTRRKLPCYQITKGGFCFLLSVSLENELQSLKKLISMHLRQWKSRQALPSVYA